MSVKHLKTVRSLQNSGHIASFAEILKLCTLTNSSIGLQRKPGKQSKSLLGTLPHDNNQTEHKWDSGRLRIYKATPSVSRFLHFDSFCIGANTSH
jgi:hypothetical protein